MALRFKLASSHRYWWPVTVRIPAADLDQAGSYDEQELRLLFEPQPFEASLAASAAFEKLRTASERSDHETRQLTEVIQDWDGVVDEAGKPVPFSAEALRQALQTRWFRAAVYVAFTQSLNGEEARRGN